MPQTFTAIGAANIITTGNTVYTTPGATKGVIIGFSVANKSANVITANVWVTRSSVLLAIGNNVTIFPGSSFVPVGLEQKLVLNAADTISVGVSLNGTADVLGSVLEIS